MVLSIPVSLRTHARRRATYLLVAVGGFVKISNQTGNILGEDAQAQKSHPVELCCDGRAAAAAV